MKKISDFTDGRKLRYVLQENANPIKWYREAKYGRQRLQRGWSDRDTWNGGEYILEVASGVLKKLGDEHSHTDWKDYFKTNYPDNLGYKSLLEVAADLDAYLAYNSTSWADNLGFELKHGTKKLPNGDCELVDLSTPDQKRRIHDAIVRSHEEHDKLYRRARKAMWFIAVNFRALWD